MKKIKIIFLSKYFSKNESINADKLDQALAMKALDLWLKEVNKE